MHGKPKSTGFRHICLIHRCNHYHQTNLSRIFRRSCPIVPSCGLLDCWKAIYPRHMPKKKDIELQKLAESEVTHLQHSTTGRRALLIFTNFNSCMTLQWINDISSGWCRLMLEQQQIKTLGCFYIICPCFEHVGMILTHFTSIIQYSTSHRKQM